ncbi:arsenate reductase (thioredoxin) [Loigolactobacillus coryniformis]|jgi:arsenate reductase|uniref:Arsenate reductase n=1 Tax=Loigolactobacillus coryniformis TaxID=1610 RepID=A0A5B8TJM4_9LACO|nr:arsenate reductase (thioredoxin) [Loigolactobacillus coryniformis]MDT3391389.1 arsenate reductase (thioredoxin) [Bacillota bacterium]RRG05400.1 MAG: arsenate reductase (thioredoxin) [Lactobacillus sp.]MBW4801591.1 arsenate reductase (thioredoxin) [Loigolactobacillus coryniformis subsp. torquens]MBW4804291.1 arsenate reductase (thioredoxin) [Loigolactobacillus coryniformis subsp. torquens]MCL5459072.1 arsenate reductase (thioredoxin) [Loigolactobacillus coryniformis]
MPQIYFLCTGNSCRSQMAEGFARQYFGQQWRIASAGIETHGLNPRAVQVMAEKGIDISQYHSKLIDIDYLNSSDLVVTLCGDARDRCPVTPPTVKKQHWPLPDPAQAQGSEAEILTVFRQVRDEIERRVQALV